MAKKQIGVRLEEEVHKAFHDAAERRGLSPARASREAIELWTGFDDSTLGHAELWTRKLRIQLETLLGNVFIEWAARRLARNEVWGRQSEVFTLFAPTVGGDLHDRLFRDFVHEERRKKAQHLRWRQDHLPLMDHEQEWLDGYDRHIAHMNESQAMIPGDPEERQAQRLREQDELADRLEREAERAEPERDE